MRVQDDTRAMLRQGHVQHGLGGGLGHVGVHALAILADHDKLIGLQLALVEAAAGHEQGQRIALDHHAVIAAGAQRPAPMMEVASGLNEIMEKNLNGGEAWDRHRATMERKVGRCKTCDQKVW